MMLVLLGKIRDQYIKSSPKLMCFLIFSDHVFRVVVPVKENVKVMLGLVRVVLEFTKK